MLWLFLLLEYVVGNSANNSGGRDANNNMYGECIATTLVLVEQKHKT